MYIVGKLTIAVIRTLVSDTTPFLWFTLCGFSLKSSAPKFRWTANGGNPQLLPKPP